MTQPERPRRAALAPRARALGAALALALPLFLTSCAHEPAASALDAPSAPGASATAPGASATPAEPAPLTGTVVVLAASSLEGAFTTLGERLEQRHPGLTVSIPSAGSSALAAQVVAGAPADVLATASSATMDAAAPHVVDPGLVATNTLVIATPADNPARVSGLDDLARGELRIALCATDVPCGAAAARAFAGAGLTPAPDTYTENVTASLGLVVSGEVDAALVYRTDARRAGPDVHTIELPDPAAGTTDLVVATVREAPNPAAADAFVDLLRSAEGRGVLEAAGFQVPS